jgi:YebC/PmpR family DNA-binding regulatory protein
MSGHSKWSTIKRKKGAEDAKRGKIFTRLGRDVMMAAREGGSDESANPKLKLAIANAKAANMPKDNIERAIKKGTGELDGGQMDEITYEGYGIEGIAFIVEVLTDNKNRSLADIKHGFNKAGGNLATTGSVQWQFDQKGYITIKSDGVDFEEAFMVAAEAGADDVEEEGDIIVIYTPREMFGAVEREVSQAGYEIEESELRWEPQNETEVSVDKAIRNMRLLDHLEGLDDVQSVSSNLSITDDVIAAYETA